MGTGLLAGTAGNQENKKESGYDEERRIIHSWSFLPLLFIRSYGAGNVLQQRRPFSAPAIRPDVLPSPVILVEAGGILIIHFRVLPLVAFPVLSDRTDFDADSAG
jgi:hypothetical protein